MDIDQDKELKELSARTEELLSRLGSLSQNLNSKKTQEIQEINNNKYLEKARPASSDYGEYQDYSHNFNSNSPVAPVGFGGFPRYMSRKTAIFTEQCFDAHGNIIQDNNINNIKNNREPEDNKTQRFDQDLSSNSRNNTSNNNFKKNNNFNEISNKLSEETPKAKEKLNFLEKNYYSPTYELSELNKLSENKIHELDELDELDSIRPSHEINFSAKAKKSAETLKIFAIFIPLFAFAVPLVFVDGAGFTLKKLGMSGISAFFSLVFSYTCWKLADMSQTLDWSYRQVLIIKAAFEKIKKNK